MFTRFIDCKAHTARDIKHTQAILFLQETDYPGYGNTNTCKHQYSNPCTNCTLQVGLSRRSLR